MMLNVESTYDESIINDYVQEVYEHVIKKPVDSNSYATALQYTLNTIERCHLNAHKSALQVAFNMYELMKDHEYKSINNVSSHYLTDTLYGILDNYDTPHYLMDRIVDRNLASYTDLLLEAYDAIYDNA